MHEKRRYGALVLHRVTEQKPNREAKTDAANIRADGYRARIDTWQGGFAVWSDKGLTDPTMPKKSARAPTVRRGRRASKPTIQRVYDELSKDLDSPPKKFTHESKSWTFDKQVWSDKEQQRLRESFAKKGFDAVVLNFKGRGYILYISRWDKKIGKPQHKAEDYLRASGRGKSRPVGVSKVLRGYRPPMTATYQGKKWTRHSCHLGVPSAADEARELSEEFHTRLFKAGTGSICIYIRAKSRRRLPAKASVRQEVFSYLDRLHKAGVTRERMIPILIEMYGMTEATSRNLVSGWVSERRLDEKPATHPGRKQVSKGVYTTKAEVQREKPTARFSGSRARQSRLIDASVIGTQAGMANRAENLLKVQVDEVLAVRQFRKNVLIMVRSGSVVKIYELLRGKTAKTERKFVERKLVDKFSATVSQAGRERAFRKEASRRGIQ